MGWDTKTIRPLGARLLVKLDEQADSYGMLHIPEDVRRQQQTGTVIAVGPGAYNDSTRRFERVGVEVGERVVFGKYNGVALPDPDDDQSGKPTPRYWMLEQEPHKRQTVKIPDCYGVVDEAVADVITEWRKPV